MKKILVVLLALILVGLIFYNFSGRMLIIRWTIHSPLPGWLKQLLWGW